MKEAISLSISYVFFLIIKDSQKWDVCIESNINTSSEGQNIHRSTHQSPEQNSHADQFEELIITPTNATLSSLGAAESSIISGVNRRSKNLFEWRPHLPWTSSAYNDYAMSFVHAVADGTSCNRVNSLTIRWPPNHFEGRHIWPWMFKSNVELFFSASCEYLSLLILRPPWAVCLFKRNVEIIPLFEPDVVFHFELNFDAKRTVNGEKMEGNKK